MAVVVKVPLHITGFWKPVYSKDPIHTGSVGAGINISEKLALVANKALEKKLYINNELISFSTMEELYKLLPRGLEARAYTKGVLGAGYGLSAAISLAYSIAYTILYKEKISLEESSQLAHIAEVKAKTGLGDVIAEYYGGLEVRIKPGPPGIGEVIKIPVDPSIRIISISLGVASTRSMLESYGIEQSKLADKYLRILLNNLDLQTFLELSYNFTRQFFDYTLANKIIGLINKNNVIGYYVKKRVLVIVVDKDRLDDITSILVNKGYYYIVSRIDYSGVEIEGTP